MRSKKQIFQDRIRRMVEYRENPSAPVDAATMLHTEAQRLISIGGPAACKMSWAFRLAAAKLESWGDPACMVRFQKVPAHNAGGMARELAAQDSKSPTKQNG